MLNEPRGAPDNEGKAIDKNDLNVEKIIIAAE